MGIEERSSTGSSMSPDVEKDKLLLQVSRRVEGGFEFGEFFFLDFRTGEVSDCPYVLFADKGWNSMVALGSVIYVVGIWERDKTRWCNIEPPNSVTNNKKGIYHKGMSFLDLSQAEVFDPISNKWEKLLPPPQVGFFDIYKDRCGVVDDENKRILIPFHSIKSVFAYYPSNNRWELVLESFSWPSVLVFAQGMILFYLPQIPKMFGAYHVATKQWLNVVLTSEVPDHVWRCEFDAMLYLGNGILCLATYSIDFDKVRTTYVYIAMFKFERASDIPGDLLVTPLPPQTYTLPTRCFGVKYFPV
ncbi:unnamed protein product [Cuscuta campestris]|uniref:F-box associated domain-containing protein n=1 Tax=Cuscuta campestris TaxID=132261 RepID=A0A484KNX8_9ASTE|nr:unnamed protein product [Cuscuta campestris]